MLMEAGAYLEAADNEGSTPLHDVAVQDYPEVTRAIIDAGADVNSRRVCGATPLMGAACFGRLGAVQELLRAGADPRFISTHPPGGACVVAVDMAAIHGHSAVVGALIQQCGIKRCGGASGGAEALRLATKCQHSDVMNMMIDAGVVDEGGSALNAAAEHGTLASVKLLLRQRENDEDAARLSYSNARDLNGSTPLLYGVAACRPCSPRIIRLLVESGADTTSTVRVTNSRGEVVQDETPLGAAMSSFYNRRVGGKDATAEQLFTLRRMGRLLRRVEAVHAISWLWPSNILSIAQGVEGTKRACTARRQLTPILTLIRRRAGVRHVRWAAVFRHSNKE